MSKRGQGKYSGIYKTFTSQADIATVGYPDPTKRVFITKGTKLICCTIPNKKGKYSISTPMGSTFTQLAIEQIKEISPEIYNKIEREQHHHPFE